MEEIFDLSPERIVSIKNEILNEVDHNKPKIEGEDNFLKALSTGAKRFSGSYFEKVMNFSREEG